MRRWHTINRAPWVIWMLFGVLVLGPLAFVFWPRGLDVRDGRHDRGRNGLALAPVWIGDDAWFSRAGCDADKPRYRDPLAISALARELRAHRVTELILEFPPPDADAMLHGADAAQVEALLYECYDARGWAQIAVTAPLIADSRWRRFFTLNLRRLLDRQPRVKGVLIEAATLLDGDVNLLALLDELRTASAGEPRPLGVVTGGWRDAYFREVARRSDQLVVPAEANSSGARRIETAIAACENKPLLFRVVCDERFRRALRYAHLGLSRNPLAEQYQGLVLAAGNEAPTAKRWSEFRERFLSRAPAAMP
jgi:hypothetical protein